MNGDLATMEEFFANLKAEGLFDKGAEIGVAEGRTSFDMLKAGLGHLLLVDQWETSPGAFGDRGFPSTWHETNFAMVKTMIARFPPYRTTIAQGFSLDVSRTIEDESLSMAYLDASHVYSDVLADLVAWAPKVKPGGVVSGHDFLSPNHPGVNKAVKYFAELHDCVVYTIKGNEPENASFYFQKKVP